MDHIPNNDLLEKTQENLDKLLDITDLASFNVQKSSASYIHQQQIFTQCNFKGKIKTKPCVKN